VLYDGRSNPLLLDQEDQPIALEKIQRGEPKKEGTTVPMFTSYVPGFTYSNLAAENQDKKSPASYKKSGALGEAKIKNVGRTKQVTEVVKNKYPIELYTK